MLRRGWAGGVLLMLGLLASGAEAQTRVQAGGGGWIGIQVEGRAMTDGSVRVMIVRVDRGSPADRAGVRPFDLLLRLNGANVSPEALAELGERLRPGLPVELTVLRANRERALRLIAGARPEPMDPATMEEFTARVDSARRQILHMVDSLLADTAWALVRGNMEAARRALIEQAEARDELDADAAMIDRTHEVMERAREAMRSLRFGPRPPRGVRFRSPHLLGDRFIAGAELEVVEAGAPADPGAEGRRFRVVQVVEGSPAERAGLAPEDVIVSIGGEPAGTLREFRARLGRLARRGRPEMRVVRGDSILVVVLPRP